jgi:RimJ/RimL family protein N-acetyltransferase
MSMADIVIRNLDTNDWEEFKDIRLAALKNHPDLFLTSYKDACHYDDDVWKETLDGKGKQVFGLFVGNKLIGITGIFTCRDDPTRKTGLMAMSYILPEYRGRGLSELLFKARIEWANSYSNFNRLKVSHRENNETSRRAILAFGFKYTGKRKIMWPDGTEDYGCEYELDLIEYSEF